MILNGYFVSILVLVLLNCCYSVRYKRADIDLQTCIDNFDVHRDKIIRTQDSQNMGAKYLNEIDLGSREECLRLCCETDDCDVFVFEEKNSGSCYLFHCGPPEDFRCKFTHHVNYSSAVLAINRHLPDLESQIKLTKHEQDLTKLRKPESEPEVIPQAVVEVRTTFPTTTSTRKTVEVLPDTMTKSTDPNEGRRKCSRYQFECRSTGECIAIYNACDGIPQCADGSDEAIELGCPDSLTTTIPVPPPVLQNNNPPLTPIRYNTASIPVPRKQQNIEPQDMYRSHAVAQIPHQIQQQPSPVASSINLDSQDIANPNLRVNPIRYDSQYAVGQIPSPNWLPHQSNQMPIPQPAQGQIPHYIDKNTHIFNHKDTGYQVPDGQEISQIPEGINRDYPKVPNYYENNYRQPMQQDNWPISPEENQYNKYEMPPPIAPNEWRNEPVKYPPPHQTLPPQPSNTVSIKHDQEKMVHELKHTPKNPIIPPVSSKTTPLEQKIKIERYPDVAAYKIGSETKDGPAETPGGAVLSLTLGLIITCIMALMIGCRLRLRKRMRKGGKSYAHDADYLVNGMYL